MTTKTEWITTEEKEIQIDHPIESLTNLATEDVQEDYYGDPVSQKQGYLTGGLYHYYITESYIRTLIGEGMTAIPPVDSVISVNLMPYAFYGNFDQFGTYTVFDTDRFPTSGKIKNTITLYRCAHVGKPTANLGTFKRYDSSQYLQAGGSFNWRKETKLQQYPYSYIEFNDHVSTPLMIEPSNFQAGESNTQTLSVRHHLNHLGIYLLYVAGYKGDSTGLHEGVVTQGLSLPTTSDAYMDYMARNQAQFKQTRTNTAVQQGMAVTTGIIGAFSADAGGNIANAVQTGVNAALEISMLQAQERDLKSSPASLKNNGGDTLFNYRATDKKMYLYRYRLNDETCERLGWYFHLFGYKQNKIMLPNLTSRKRYNYIKTIQANLKTNGIPKVYAKQLADIFNQGVTLWHVDNGVAVKDYSMDNEEV